MFPRAFAKIDWRMRTDLLVGPAVRTLGCVFFWCSRFGDAAEVSNVVDDFPRHLPRWKSFSQGCFLSPYLLVFPWFEAHSTCELS